MELMYVVSVCVKGFITSVRSPAPNGRYRAPAPSALTKLFAFCADRRPLRSAAPRSPPRTLRPCRSRVRGAAGAIHTTFRKPLRSNHWLPNGVNEVICSEPGAGLSLQGTANRTDLGPPALGCSSPIPGVARPPSIIPSSVPPFAGSIADLARIRVLRPLAEHPIVCSHTCPSSSENSAGRPRRLFAPTNNRRLPWTKIPPCSPGAGGSGPKTPITLEFIQQVLTKALSEIGYEAPQDVVKKLIAKVTPVSSRASSRATSPMKTNKNKRQASSSSDEGATCSDSTVVGSDSESENSNTSFTLVEGKNKRALRKALKKAKVARDQPEMDIDPSSAPTSRANDAKPSPPRSNRLRLRVPPRLSQPEIQSPLPRRRPLSAAFLPTGRRNPSRPLRPGLPCALGAQTLPQRRLTIMASSRRPSRTEEAKNIFNNLNMVCGLSVSSRGPAQERRSRAVPLLPVVRPRGRQLSCGPALREMFGPTLDQRVPRTRESGEKPSCMNCLQQHTANYRGYPKAPKFISHNRPNPNRPKSRPVASPRDLNNFPDLAGNKPTSSAAASRPASNPWVNQIPRCHRGPLRDHPERLSTASHPCRPRFPTAGTSSFGDDIQTVMSILRAVKSSRFRNSPEISERAVTSKRNSWFSSDTIT
ncbi:hypothetical protein EVAR_73011_1 [Eumeta japonica]|uniref:Uncharacterized protein n=1 Tax=Eumeta variegata TaxID=151549 RepID=A0A4C2AEA5_EUMVA|nr:hypothetical protein EVAR_73011_1 [Eumeta japonica]